MINENWQQLAHPNVYTDENEIIPYSPRGKFGFMHPTDTTNGMTIKLESMKDMSIDQIVELYKKGFRIEDSAPISQILTAQNGITISSGALLLIGIGIFAYLLLKR